LKAVARLQAVPLQVIFQGPDCAVMRLDGCEQSVDLDDGARRSLRRAEIRRLVHYPEVARDPREEKSDVGFGV